MVGLRCSPCGCEYLSALLLRQIGIKRIDGVLQRSVVVLTNELVGVLQFSLELAQVGRDDVSLLSQRADGLGRQLLIAVKFAECGSDTTVGVGIHLVGIGHAVGVCALAVCLRLLSCRCQFLLSLHGLFRPAVELLEGLLGEVFERIGYISIYGSADAARTCSDLVCAQIDAHAVAVAVGHLLCLPDLVGDDGAEYSFQGAAQFLITALGHLLAVQSVDDGQRIGSVALLVHVVLDATAYRVPLAPDAALHVGRQCVYRSNTRCPGLLDVLASFLVDVLLLLVQSLLLQFLLQRIHYLPVSQRHLLGCCLLVEHVAQIGAVLRVDFADQSRPLAVGFVALVGSLLQVCLFLLQLLLLVGQSLAGLGAVVLALAQVVHLFTQGFRLLLQFALLLLRFLRLLVGGIVGFEQVVHVTLCLCFLVVKFCQLPVQFAGGLSRLIEAQGEIAQCGYHGHDDVRLQGSVESLCRYLRPDGSLLLCTVCPNQLPFQYDVFLGVHACQCNRLAQALDAGDGLHEDTLA